MILLELLKGPRNFYKLLSATIVARVIYVKKSFDAN